MELRGWVDWRAQPRPVDWDSVFARSGPLELEIGCGDGGFLVESAAARPDHGFIGIESKPHRAGRTLRRAARAGIDNVAVLCCDAQVALERLFVERSLVRAVSLFCDPWPKKKHFKFRLFSKGFNTLLNSRLQEDGKVLIVTDHAPYAEWILEEVEGCGFEAEHDLVGPRFGTRFEGIWSDGGQDVFHRLRLVKVEHRSVPLLRDRELPQRDVEGGDLREFRLRDRSGDSVVAFKKVEVEPALDRARVKAVVVEGRLQQWAVLTVRRQGRVWELRFEAPETLVPTEGLWAMLLQVEAALLSSCDPISPDGLA